MREISDRDPAGLSHCIASIASNLFFKVSCCCGRARLWEILAQGYNPVEWDWCIEIAELMEESAISGLPVALWHTEDAYLLI